MVIQKSTIRINIHVRKPIQKHNLEIDFWTCFLTVTLLRFCSTTFDRGEAAAPNHHGLDLGAELLPYLVRQLRAQTVFEEILPGVRAPLCQVFSPGGRKGAVLLQRNEGARKDTEDVQRKTGSPSGEATSGLEKKDDGNVVYQSSSHMFVQPMHAKIIEMR